MSRDLTTSQPVRLPSVDVREPSAMLCLPVWLTQQLGAVSDLGEGRVILGPNREVLRAVATIPASLMPTGPQRQAIAQRIAELHEAQRPGPMQQTVAIIAGLLDEHATGRTDSTQAGAKTDAYLDALEDLPAWAVREALRRWRRAEVEGVDARDFDFAPKPPRLRKIALGIVNMARGQALRLQRILDAEPIERLTEAEEAHIAKALAEIVGGASRTVETEEA